MSRSEMFLLALVMMHVLLGLLSLVVSRSQRHSQALRLWGIGLLVYSAGALIIVLTPLFSLDVRQVLGNTLVTSSGIFTTTGLLAHTRWRLNLPAAIAGLAFVCVALAINHYGETRYIIDVGTPTIYATILYLYAAIGIFRAQADQHRNAMRFVGATIIAVVVVWNIRFALVWQAAGNAPDATAADLVLAAFAIIQLLTVVAATFGLLWVEVRLVEGDLERAALSDWLTGLQNRRAMHSRFKEELSRAERQEQPFALVTFDIDHFKKVNDEFGHLAGDAMLREIATTLRDAKREEDHLGRHGGEEFLLLLPNQGMDEAKRMAERLREQVANLVVDYCGQELHVTISAGVSAYPRDGDSWDRLFGAADRRLYKAKHGGRNRVEFSD